MASPTEHPLAPKRNLQAARRTLSRDDVGNQARYLLNNYIHERMNRDGITEAPAVDELMEPGTPAGPPMEHVREVARALRCIGDELDRDEKLQDLISRIPPDAPQQTFRNVARTIFQDGIYNWGRVVTLFYFAYKMAVKALDKIPLIRAIINLVVTFIIDFVAPWIIERGGWEAIVEYFGTPAQQVVAVMGLGFATVAGIYLWKSWS